jgi:transglutaminase-like putative cysteine protease
MYRRTLLAASALTTALAHPIGVRALAAEAAPMAGWRRFELTTRVTLLNSSGPAQLWLPLAQTSGGYQTAISPRWTGNGRAVLVHDTCYGAAMLRGIWDGRNSAQQQIEVVQEVTTHDRGALNLLPLTAADRQLWTAATESVPTDSIVRETAEKITTGRTSPRDRLRAIYDWVVDTTWRNPETPGCGTGDFRTMLQTGNFGGKCADINGLAVGLARAAGFPARDVYGIRVADSRQFPALGKSDEISKAQHCRAEVFLEDEGWFPLDPADVRKVVLDGKLALDSDAVRALRDRLFGSWEMNWVGFNSATDIQLPGMPPQHQPNFAFLMYPCAFTTAGQPDCLDPARFRYEITSRELTV